jgi:hypothetical protein
MKDSTGQRELFCRDANTVLMKPATARVTLDLPQKEKHMLLGYSQIELDASINVPRNIDKLICEG